MAIFASTSDHCLLDLIRRQRRGELSMTISMVVPDHPDRAEERGVKVIGATAHDVTEDLDEGPIIEQDVVRVSHQDSAQELVRRGADVERQVLSRAVLWHCQDRVVRQDRRTIVL